MMSQRNWTCILVWLLWLVRLWLLGESVSTPCIYDEGKGDVDGPSYYFTYMSSSNYVFTQQFNMLDDAVMHSITVYYQPYTTNTVSEGNITLEVFVQPKDHCNYRTDYPYWYGEGYYVEQSTVAYPIPSTNTGIIPINFPLSDQVYYTNSCYVFTLYTPTTITTNTYYLVLAFECEMGADTCTKWDATTEYNGDCSGCLSSMVYRLNGTSNNEEYCGSDSVGFLVALGCSLCCALCVCRLGPKVRTPGEYNCCARGIFAKALMSLDVIGKLVSESYNVIYIFLITSFVWPNCSGWVRFYLFQAMLFEFTSSIANLLMLVNQVGDYFDSNAVLLKIIIIITQCFSFAVSGAIVAETYVDTHWLYRCARACFILWWLAPLVTRSNTNVAFKYFMLFFIASIFFAFYSFVVTRKSFDVFVQDKVDDDKSEGRDTLYWFYIACKCIFVVLAILKSLIKAWWRSKLTKYVELLHLRFQLELLGLYITALNRFHYDSELNQLYEEVVKAVDEKLVDMHDILY